MVKHVLVYILCLSQWNGTMKDLLTSSEFQFLITQTMMFSEWVASFKNLSNNGHATKFRFCMPPMGGTLSHQGHTHTHTRHYEAMISLRVLGLSDTDMYFPSLEFYDSGSHPEKNSLGVQDKKDIDILGSWMGKLDTVFLCADKDPSGTHAKVFSLCVRAMMHMDVRPTVILYKGAWDPLPEWEQYLGGRVEVRLSEHEAKQKSQAIMAHKSQMSNGPHVVLGGNPDSFHERVMKLSNTCEFAKITGKPCHVEEFRVYDFDKQTV